MFRSCSNMHRLIRLYSVINRQHAIKMSFTKCTYIPAQIRYKEYSVIANSDNKNVESAKARPEGESIEYNRASKSSGQSSKAEQLLEVENSTVATGEEDQDRKLKILKLEVSVLRQEGRKVPDPDAMKPAHWDQLMQLTTKSARTKYYTFLWSIERKKESAQVTCSTIL